MIVPIKEDMRYRSWKEVKSPQSNAVIIYMMDVSGSMGEEQKEIVRIEASGSTPGCAHYKASRPLHHPRRAARRKWTSTPSSTCASPAARDHLGLQAGDQVIDSATTRPTSGTSTCSTSPTATTGAEATAKCMELLKEQLLPDANLFGYGQVESRYGSGQFMQ